LPELIEIWPGFDRKGTALGATTTYGERGMAPGAVAQRNPPI